MNSLIKQQLEKCKVAQVPSFNETDTEIFIPKKQPEPTVQVNKYYLIELEDYILHEPDGFTLSANWNRGSVPTCKHYIALITQSMGKMFKTECTGYDVSSQSTLEKQWKGWLPREGFHIIKEL